MNVFAQLKEKGYRLTKPRQELLQTLVAYPLSAQEIFALLKNKKINIDLASVYRSLEVFVNLGIVHVIDVGGDKKRYELADADNHHHHLVCNNCGTIEDIKVEEDFLKKLSLKTKFKIDHHHLEFFGQCNHCQ